MKKSAKSALRAVIDTNVLVSAQLNPRGGPALVLARLQERRFTLVTSEPLLAELASVLARPRIARRSPLTPEDANKLLGFLREAAHLVPVTGDVAVCRDPKDNVVIETALKGGAAVIVSRDEDLTRATELVGYLAAAGIRVLTVRQFLLELETPDDE